MDYGKRNKFAKNPIQLEWDFSFLPPAVLENNQDLTSFPSPPFQGKTVNLDRIASFLRAIVAPFSNLVILGKGDIIQMLSAFFFNRERGVEERKIVLCDSSNAEMLAYLVENDDFSSPKTGWLILGRIAEELELLALSLGLKASQKILVGSEHGFFSEAARVLFLPFFPVNIQFENFWQRTELVFIPLAAAGLSIEELDHGFQTGYQEGESPAKLFSLFLLTCARQGIDRVIIVTENLFLLSLLNALLPFLCQSCAETPTCSFEVLDWWSARGLLSGGARNNLFILVDQKTNLKPSITVPSSFRSNPVFRQTILRLDQKPIDRMVKTGLTVFAEKLRENNLPAAFLHFRNSGLELGGNVISFFHYVICYNSWLRDQDFFSEQPGNDFDQSFWKSM